ncbi:MAG: PorT family protein [Bergeyella sp.]|nr:PorT family protein [Bergeyella sp.]
MKKFLNVSFLCIALGASAQVSFSGKANLLFPANTASWKGISSTAEQAYKDGGKSSVGFNVGVSSKISLPLSLFLMPEIYYTSFKNEIYEEKTGTKIVAKNKRIDIPLLVGYNFLGKLVGIFAGPVFSYDLNKQKNYGNFVQQDSDRFTTGYQLGVETRISKLIISAKYEGAFTGDQRYFVDKKIASGGYKVKYDNRQGLFMVGIGYVF